MANTEHKIDSLQHFLTKLTNLQVFLSANRVPNIDRGTWDLHIGWRMESWQKIYYATKASIDGAAGSSRRSDQSSSALATSLDEEGEG